MEERPPIWRVAADVLNKQYRRADEGWSSSLGVRRDARNRRCSEAVTCTVPRTWNDSLYDLSNEKGT